MKKFELVKAEADVQEKIFYTIAELAKLFDVSRQTIHNWNNDGRFPTSITVGDKNTVLIPVPDVEAVRKEELEKLAERIEFLQAVS